MIRKTILLTALAVAFGHATDASAQLLNGQFWKGKLAGKTRIVEAAPVIDEAGSQDGEGEGDPADRSLEKGKLKKTEVYILTEWLPKAESYGLTVWTERGGEWVREDDAGLLSPFGEGFPDTKDAGVDMTVYLDSELGTEKRIDLYGLVRIKAKEDKKQPPTTGTDEVQTVVVDATTGTYTLTFGADTTGELDFDAAQEDIQGALEGLPTIGAGNVTVVEDPDGTYTITFVGDLAEQDVDDLVVETNDTDGTVDASVTTAGSAGMGAVLKSGSLKLDGVGSSMSSENYCGEGNELLGSPKFSAKRVKEDQLPFDPAPKEL